MKEVDQHLPVLLKLAHGLRCASVRMTDNNKPFGKILWTAQIFYSFACMAHRAVVTSIDFHVFGKVQGLCMAF